MANKYYLPGVGNYQSRHNNREKKVLQTAAAGKELQDTFESAVAVSSTNNADGTAYTGAAAEVLALQSGKAAYEAYVAAVAVGAAVLAPFQSVDGLELPSLVASTGPESWELTNGTTALSRHARTVGAVDGPFYWECKFKIDTISSVTEIFAGFRKAEAYQLDPDNYDEMAAFHIGNIDNGRISIATILNNGATSMTDTTETDWANGGVHTLRIEVDTQGYCTFLYDGAAPAVSTTFQFDAGEVLLPFFHLNTETADPGVSISNWNVGALKP